jgi:hypothetical protein
VSTDQRGQRRADPASVSSVDPGMTNPPPAGPPAAPARDGTNEHELTRTVGSGYRSGGGATVFPLNSGQEQGRALRRTSGGYVQGRLHVSPVSVDPMWPRRHATAAADRVHITQHATRKRSLLPRADTVLCGLADRAWVHRVVGNGFGACGSQGLRLIAGTAIIGMGIGAGLRLAGKVFKWMWKLAKRADDVPRAPPRKPARRRTRAGCRPRPALAPCMAAPPGERADKRPGRRA